jgi:hypothetical protein
MARRPARRPVALDRMLADDAARFRRRWLVVEGVYTMDGDRWPLAALGTRRARATAPSPTWTTRTPTGVLALGRGGSAAGSTGA